MDRQAKRIKVEEADPDWNFVKIEINISPTEEVSKKPKFEDDIGGVKYEEDTTGDSFQSWDTLSCDSSTDYLFSKLLDDDTKNEDELFYLSLAKMVKSLPHKAIDKAMSIHSKSVHLAELLSYQHMGANRSDVKRKRKRKLK